MPIVTNIGAVLSTLWKVVDWIRRAVLNAVFLLILITVLVAVFAEPEESLHSNSVLVLDPSGVLVEEVRTPDPAEAILREMDRDNGLAEETRTQDLVDAIMRAADDPKILAMVIEPGNLRGCDTAKLLSVGKAIKAFKERGKPVLGHATAFNQGQYLLASYANQVSVAPLGGVAITGYGMYQTFFKGLLDKARVNFHVFRVGDYKSAVEPFTRESMSEEAKSMSQAWLNDLWRIYQGEVIANRRLSGDAVSHYVENIDTALAAFSGNAAKLAVSAKLVDSIQTEDQFKQSLADKLETKPENLHRIGWRDYLRANPVPEPQTRELVGVIRARGAIMPGRQPGDMIGSQSVGELFEQARKDPTVVAVVLRIDSPGGSATASEEIHREIIRTQDAGKPVVVSMGSLAASGAYWIASAANRIVAEPSTLTGSIGIFAAFPTFENTAREWGVTTDGVGTTSIADLGHPLRPLAGKTGAALQQLLRFGYDTFLERVSKGRRMTLDQVEASAEGRVFSGREAQSRKLVDQLGGLDEAILAASDLAGLSVAASKELRRELSPRETLIQRLFSSGAALFATHAPHLGPLLSTLDDQARMLSSFADPQHLYARSFECEASVY